MLRDVGVELDRGYWDWLHLRIQPHQDFTETGTLGYHRDTWSSNVYAQTNWWTPLLPITRERTIALYPAYWLRPLGNTSATWDLERVREMRPSPAGRGLDGGSDGRSLADGPFAAPIGAPPVGLAPGLRALVHGRVEQAFRLLAGRGDGLTPAGDDALAGYAAWRHSTGRPVAISGLAAGRSSALGLAYLRCAERGELPGAGVALLAALRRGDPAAASAAARNLRRWGASSGDAMLSGIAAGAKREGFILDCPPMGWAGQDGSGCRRGPGPRSDAARG